MTRVNFCVFNHRPIGITDQVEFMDAVFTELGWQVTVSDCLAADALNFVLECFLPASKGGSQVARIAAFCRRHRKRVGIIMSEHIELDEDGLTFNGTPLHDRTYIDDKESRILGLVELSEFAFAFFTLGCLPELNSFGSLLPRHRVYRLPFPTIAPAGQPAGAQRIDYDLVFTGSMTPYRQQILDALSRQYKVHVASQGMAEEDRFGLCQRSRLILNVPQMPGWTWISPMRVMFGLRAGRATLHHGGELRQTAFDASVKTELPIDTALRDWQGTYVAQQRQYQELVDSYWRHFPRAVLEVWARLEGISAG